jgi:hypothetical protein
MFINTSEKRLVTYLTYLVVGGWQDGTSQLASISNLGSSSITLLGLVGLLGEHNQAGLVSLQALNVVLQGVLRLIDAAVVNGNADGLSVLGGDTSLLRNQATKIRCGIRHNKPPKRTLSSAKEKPLPNFTLELYFWVGQWTSGLKAPAAGLGAALAAFSLRKLRRIFF